MKTKHIIIGLVVILFVIFFMQNKEHAGSTGSTPNLSSEAVQNIAKVYADSAQTASFNNIRVSGNTTVNKDTTLNGNVEIPKWRGMITMWSGTITDIPKGWALCDGTNGTPDLRGKFILGMGQGKNPSGVNLTERRMNDQGGAETHALTKEEMPSHTHQIWFPCEGGNCNSGGPWFKYDSSDYRKLISDQIKYTGGDNTITTAPGFDANKPETWASKPHNNMPPYYVLAYIMKI